MRFSFLYFRSVFIKTIIPLAPVGFEMIVANWTPRSLSIISHLINSRLWNTCLVYKSTMRNEVGCQSEGKIRYKKGKTRYGVPHFMPKKEIKAITVWYRKRGTFPKLGAKIGTKRLVRSSSWSGCVLPMLSRLI